jgi:hypothetical protein
MDFFEAQNFFKQAYPGKKISFEFDEKCQRFHQLVYTDGNPNPMHHIENHKVKVTIEGQPPIYVSIKPHRETATWVHMKKLIDSKNDVHINDEDLREMNCLSGKEKEAWIAQWMVYTGLTKDQILVKVAGMAKA